MVRTRRMAALTGDENNGQDNNTNATVNEPQPMDIVDEKPVRARKAPGKAKGMKPSKQEAAPQILVKEEEQVEGTGHVEQQEPGTSNHTIAPNNEQGKSVDPSDQPSATANTRTSVKRAQPKAIKSKCQDQDSCCHRDPEVGGTRKRVGS